MLIDLKVTNETGLAPEPAAALQLMAHLAGIVDCMKVLGLSREQAVARIGNGLDAAWAEREATRAHPI